MNAWNPVRELQPGERPRDWMEPTDRTEPLERTPANDDETVKPPGAAALPAESAPARLEPQRYGIQFEASEEYVELVQRAKALLCHAAPGADLSELHLRAMRALVAELEREKYAVNTPRPRSSAAPTGGHEASDRLESPKPPRQRGRHEDSDRIESPKPPRQRGRHVPAAIRRAVFERDSGRCTYRSHDTGERCRETERLELHHTQAFARGGEHGLENVTLHCHAHNALAAEDDFGRGFVERARDSRPHESWAVHEPAPPIKPG